SNGTTTKLEPKIVGGSSVSIDQYPYTVSIRLTATDRKSYGSGHICGGVVISQRLVATAAHCCYNTNTKKQRTAGEYFLVMGSTYLRSSTSNTLEYYLQKLIVHENYNPEALSDDIALMFINGYIPWNWSSVRAVPLYSGILAAGTNCSISGWGLLAESGSSSSNVLQAATVPVIGTSVCSVAYGALPNSQVCAGYSTGGVDACQGDSGGPMVCGSSLGGIVSYGVGCAKAGYPGVYTNVSYYNGWIVQQNSSFNYSLYQSSGLRTAPGSALLLGLPVCLGLIFLR
ncbi:hypothetical protein KR018_001107, partial [Drosophila ironensis]